MFRSRLLALTAALALSLTALLANPAPPVAQATGDCGIATLTLYNGLNQTGTSRTYCAYTADADIQSESPSNIMGPLSDGSFANDFDPSSTSSGVESARFINCVGPPPCGLSTQICFYNGINYTGNLTGFAFLGSGGVRNVNFTSGNTGSFFWQKPAGNCP